MTVLHLIFVLIRFLAVWMFVLSVQTSGIVIVFLNSGFGAAIRSPMEAFWVPLVMFLACGAVLWFGAGPISRALSMKGAEAQSLQLQPGGLFRVGCCLIGVYSIVQALPILVSFALLGTVWEVEEGQWEQLNVTYLVGGAAVKALVGAFVFFKSAWLYKLASGPAANGRA